MAETNVNSEKKAVKTKKVSAPDVTAKSKPSTAKKTTVAKKTATAKKTSAAKPAAKKTKANTADLGQRYRTIEVAAYYIAENDGFTGSPVDYWIAAETQINKLLS